ncbi:hypothetical protein BGW36DRAFT_378978 [Talaromyces proteolyticus]|uniref:AGC-kinase C-terminal domain-containing protein n=1 Tax=Talaromyces proteolyticus TaxID=1131652 RepID=A0AAD4Q0F9_9EURO|nr:uncharacterized protein BGW36DRAFT_378978 [Talaromyces proteolyticus]KAH8697592.1 hypothetical protein BGW36DRAFT_378978 [Talaromyces proteolyticus]
MPPSTVFSYWRRDHRRISPIPGSESPLGLSPGSYADAPPQLPGLPLSTALGDSLVESTTLPESFPSAPVFEQHVRDIGEDQALAFGLSSQQSLGNLRVPSTSTDNLVRPHSSPGDGDGDITPDGLSPQTNHLQPPSALPLRPDLMQTNSAKTNGTWRLGFKQNTPTQHIEHKASPRNNTTAKNLRINTNVDGLSGFVGGASLKGLETIQPPRHDGLHHEQSTEPAQQKQRRTKLHLLNPISLLAHRRSSQIANARLDDGNFGIQNVVPAIPDDYDPRIRGKIVHDFSAPRPRRQMAGAPNSREQSEEGSTSNKRTEQRKRHSEYSPVFKEHFGEDRKVLQVENKGYLQSSLLTDSNLGNHDPSDLPAFARKLPANVPENNSQSIEPKTEASEPVYSTPSKRTSPPSNPRKSTESSRHASSVPMRLKSDASRFSFDMGGVGSSVQEKLLEEKHKEKEAARKDNFPQSRFSYSDFDEDEFDYDAMEDDGGFEERIPGVNADAEDDDQFSDFAGVVKTSEPLFVPVLPTIAASPISPMNPQIPLLKTTVDAHEGSANAVPTTETFLLDETRSLSDYGDEEEDDGNEMGVKSNQVAEAESEATAATMSNKAYMSESLSQQEDDDMYFNDGDIDEFITDANEGTFDESIFDDENSELFGRQFYPGTRIPAAIQNPSGGNLSLKSNDYGAGKNVNIRHVPSLVSEFRPESWDIQNDITIKLSSGEMPKAASGVLSEHNLEAFHSALARVADDLPQRNISLSETSLGQESNSQNADSHPGLISDDSRHSQNMAIDDTIDDFNYDDDDGFDDDLIIAEANADALEHDDEGFYGREFGFYAQSTGNCNAQPIYGGYFGGHNGGVIFREPSLTPITERSEWSTRNSIVSLSTHGPAAAQANPLANAGLAQLVDFGNIDDEMSFEALMRLRRGAFGGSNGSLRSSAGSLSPQYGPVGPSNRGSFMSIPEDSPVDLMSGTDFPSHPVDRLNSGHHNSSPSSEGESAPGSPTLTFGQSTSVKEDGGLGNTPKPSHSRASSSASISYKQETVEDGSNKWVLERRRTSDSGEVEVYQREVLEQGRI